MALDMIATRNTYVAVAIESTAGEYETISDNDFIPVLDGFSHTPGYETIESKEFSGKLDKRVGRRAMQAGSVSLPVYLKGGGGTNKPWFDALLQSVFSDAVSTISGSNKTSSGNAALKTILASPSPTKSTFDIAVAADWLDAGDVLLVDVSATSTPSWEQATVLTAAFDTDHESVTLTADLSAIPTATHAIQLISRVDVEGSPGLAAGDVIAVNVSHTATAEYETVLVLSVTGTTTQKVKVWPYFSQEPLDEAVVVGGHTYKPQSSGHDTCTVSIFLDCVGQDGVRYDYAGVRFNMKLQGATTGQIAELLFEGTAQKWQVSSSGTNFSTLGLTPSTGPTHNPPICVGADICLDSARETIHTQNLELDAGLVVALRKSMIPSSGVRSSRYSERGTNGKFDLDLLDESEYDAWGDGDRAPLLVTFWDDNQTIVMIAPYIKRTNVENADSEGIQIQNVTWMADPDDDIGTFYMGFLPGALAPAA